jgi:predicted RNA-binding Zn ribbon-like protein
MYLAGVAFDVLFESVNSYGELSEELQVFRKLLQTIARKEQISMPLAREFSRLLARAHNFRRLSPSPKSWEAPKWKFFGVPSSERTHLEFALLLEELLNPEFFRRVKECSAPWCSGLFLDLSKNLSRHWCLQPGCEQRRKKEKSKKYYDKHRRIK